MIVRASKSIITPTCPKCGRLRREYARMNRRRLGIWGLHRMCCCETCESCTGCEACRPDCYRIRFSNIQLCGCFGLSGGRSQAYSFAEDPIEFDVHDSCLVTRTLNNLIVRRRWNSNDCSGEPFETTAFNATAIFGASVVSGDVQLLATLCWRIDSSWSERFFHAVVTPFEGDWCADGVTINNQLTVGDCLDLRDPSEMGGIGCAAGINQIHGYGGTMEIIPNCLESP